MKIEFEATLKSVLLNSRFYFSFKDAVYLPRVERVMKTRPTREVISNEKSLDKNLCDNEARREIKLNLKVRISTSKLSKSVLLVFQHF